MARLWAMVWWIGVAVLAFAVVVIHAATILKWMHPVPGLNSASVFVGGAAIFVEGIRTAVSAYRAPFIEREKRQMEKAVLACLDAIAEATGCDLKRLGGSVYTVRERHHRPRFKRILRYRLSDYPQPSDVKWSDGKGAIGRAWAQKKEIHADWRPIAEKYGDGSLTREGFDALRDETKWGFDYEEFNGIVAKYAEILARPIWNSDSSRPIGILAIDLPMAAAQAHPERRQHLNAVRINEITSSCAVTLSNVMSKQ